MFYFLRRYLTYIHAMGKYLKGLPSRTRSPHFICAALILLCTAVAALWFNNQKTQKLRTEVLPVVQDSAHSNKPKSPEITQPGAKVLELFFLAMMESLNQEDTLLEDSSPAHDPKEVNEEIQRESIYHAANNQETADGGYRDGSSYTKDGRFHGPVDENHGRTRADLVKCITELERVEPARMERAIRDLWIIAADTGVPEEALEALEYLIVQNHDSEVIKLAEFALADLRRLTRMKEDAPTHAYADTSEEDQTGDRNEVSAVDGRKADLQGEPESLSAKSNEQSAILQARMDELREQAIMGWNEKDRKVAIQTLSSFRNEAAVDVLIEAADDPDPNNRYQALKALWYSAADGLEKDSNIRLCLQQALGDSDERVSELAAKAIADIDALEAARLQAETAIPSTDDLTIHIPTYNEDGSLTSM